MRGSSRYGRLYSAARKITQGIQPFQGNQVNTRLGALIATEGLLAAIVVNLATAYTSMFATRMGATANQIGLVAALPQFFAMIILIPGALLAGGMRDRRRPVEIAVILSGIFFGLAGFSPFLGNIKIWFLIGTVALANAPIALYNASWQNYFSDIVGPAERNSLYTRRTSMTFFAGIITVQLIGILIGYAGSDHLRIWLYQGCYWLAFIVTIFQFRVLRRSPPDIGQKTAVNWRDIGGALRELIQCSHLKTFVIISFIFHFGWYMAWPLFFLTEVKYLGADEAWLSYISVSGMVLQWLTVKPWGRFIERKGIRMALVIGCIGLTTNPLFAIFSAHFPADVRLPVMLVLNLINSCTYSAFQLSLLQCLLEAVPARYKGLNLSIYTSVLLLAFTLGPIFGVQLYTFLGTDLQAMTAAMILSSIIRLGGTLLFFWRWYKLRNEPDCGIRI